jgi:membrane associated rhomboid family serine protease
MIPIRDDNPQILTPVVTLLLIALNAASWTFLQGLGATDPLARSVCELGLIPGELLGRLEPGTSFELSELHRCTIGADPVWFTPLTSMFLHGGWLHLLGNMWFLWIFGDNVEDSMGPVRFAVFYLLCGLAAAALQVGFHPDSNVPMVGASGAIGGVMGAYVVLYPHVRVHLAVPIGFYISRMTLPAYTMLGYWLLVQLVGGAIDLGARQGGGVAFWAHVGGFAAGMLLVFVFRDEALLRRHPYHGWSARRGRPG